MTYNELAELFKREGGDAQVCFSVISQNQILFGNNDIKKDIISFKNEEPIKWVKEVQEEPVSEELQLEKAAKDYSWIISKQVELVEKVMGHGAKIEKEDITNAFITGAKWQRQQLIKDAIKTDVKADKDGLYTDESWDEMNGFLQKIGAKAGDKVYISIIKQEEE